MLGYMGRPHAALYGRNIKDIARICGVDLTTARRWKRGARCPPQSAVLLILGDLGMFDPEWAGWRIRGDTLISPEGWQITENDVLATPLMRMQLANAQAELKRLKQSLLSQEQPLPDSWPEWVTKLGA